MIDLRFAYIDGYKPLGNYQELLYEVVAERLPLAMTLQQAATAVVKQEVDQPPVVPDILAMLVNPTSTG